MTIWKSNIKGDDRIIAYYDKIIYKGNPRQEEMENIVRELNLGNKQIPSLFSVPQTLLKEVNFEEGKNYIEILFGSDSNEHLKINDLSRKQEIFNSLKDKIPNSKYEVENYSKFKAGKKPLIAMLFITIIFSWTLYIASQIENGNQYEIVGSGRSIAAIVLAMASLGISNVILIFGSLLILALLGFIFKIKKPKVVHRIIIVR